MKERPIIFNGDMVRAILDGSKTQTRRIMKPQPGQITAAGRPLFFEHGDTGRRIKPVCPHGQTGDRLWVRETWGDSTKGADAMGGTHYASPWFRADADAYGLLGHDDFGAVYAEEIKWRPSIHMPRWASRITLEIVSVRVERLQDISERDAMAEGAEHDGEGYCWVPSLLITASDSCRNSFKELWKSIYGPGSWNENPWVWVIEFKRV